LLLSRAAGDDLDEANAQQYRGRDRARNNFLVTGLSG
jgi:hypothetical protein